MKYVLKYVLCALVLLMQSSEIISTPAQSKPLNGWRLAVEYAKGYWDAIYGAYILSHQTVYEHNYIKGYEDPKWWNKALNKHKNLASAIGFAEAQGKRPTMEDAHAIDLQNDHAYVALFDGHGGRSVADFAAEHLHHDVAHALRNTGDESYTLCSDTKVITAIEAAFSKIDKDLSAITFAQKQGCTAIVTVLKSGKIFAANAGDSRAVLCREGKALALSEDHKPDRPDEKERIEKLGGEVTKDLLLRRNKKGETVLIRDVPRIKGLAIARSLGDKDRYPFVIPNPEIRTASLQPNDEFLILACDGVWDVMDNQAAVDLVKKSLNQHKTDVNKAAAILKDEALKRGSTDNVSVIIVDLKNQKE